MRSLFLLGLLVAGPAEAQFVEPVDVLHTLAGAPNEFFGDCIDRVDDLDGDRISDLVVGAPFGAAGGRAVAYSGRTGALIFEMRASRSGIQFGWEVASLGRDILVSAPNDGAGSVTIYSGTTRTALQTLRGDVAGDRFGERIAHLGDGAFIVGAPAANAAYLFSATGERLLVLRGDANGDRFGSAVAGIGDVDDDGVKDIAIGADTAGSDRHGRVYLISGRTKERVRVLAGDVDGANFGRYYVGGNSDWIVTADITRAANTGRAYVLSARSGSILRTYSGTAPEQYFGTGTRLGSDWDGDGVTDLFVGAAFENGLAGKAYFFSGSSGALIRTMTASRTGGTLAARAVDLGDVDGDGLPDVLLAAPRGSTVYVISGTSFPRVKIAPGKRRRGVSPR